MRLRQLSFLAVTLGIGLFATAAWLAAADLNELRATAANIRWSWVPLLPALTLMHLVVRFLRWTFLLRRIQAFVPLRESLRIFLSGFSMIATPLHSGEILKALLLRHRIGTPLRRTSAVVVAERMFDLLALLLILAVLQLHRWYIVVPVAGLLLVIGAAFFSRFGEFDPASAPHGRLRSVASNFALQLKPFPFLGGLSLSVVAWVAGALVLSAATAAVGAPTEIAESASAFCIATPLGALSFLPGGVGVTGSLMIPQLLPLGLTLAQASLAVLLTRLCTFWLAFALGSLVLAWTLRHAPETSELEQHEHFDELAGTYSGEIPEHMRAHFLRKKIEAMAPRIPREGLGLDLGCGHGWYLSEMVERGRSMIGMDLSLNQLGNAREFCDPNTRFLQGDVLAIPVADRSVDYAYCVNAMHHIEDAEAQVRAVTEMLRVLKPGGVLFIHEINVTNPLFRFYMGYVFPLVARIELGTERYLTPGDLPRVAGAEIEDVVYFTFLPDFLPAIAFRWLEPIESWLERSSLRHGSAHFMAVYRKG